MKQFRSISESGRYRVEGDVSREEIVKFAQKLLSRRFRRGTTLGSTSAAKDYFCLKLAEYEHEVFAALYLDSQHRILAFEEVFNGTIDGCSVYPREVAKRALANNAAAVIFVHNHPSGIPEPSDADRSITQRLKQALELFDVRVLDHFIVGGDQVVSFAQRGLL